MELSIYDIVKKPMITAKCVDLYKRLGQVVFEVSVNANKPVIQSAIEKIWNVKVDKIRVMNMRGKVKNFSRKAYKRSDRKKAIVTLKKGYAIDIPGLYDAIRTAGGMRQEATEGQGE